LQAAFRCDPSHRFAGPCLLVIVAKDGDREPRHLVSGANDTAQLFGVDVNGFAPGLARA